MRQRGGTARLYQLSESTESTQKSCRRPCSSFSRTTLTMPRSSNSKKRPQEEGNTSAMRPACPKTSSSMSRPSEGENHLWYSRFIASPSAGFSSANLMQSYFTGAVVIALEPLIPSSLKAPLERPEHEPISANTSEDPTSEDIAEELDSNPRYSVRKFHSE